MTCKDCLHEQCYTKDLEDVGTCNFFIDKNKYAKVVRCRDCDYYEPYQKPVEDFDGRCIVRECETDETEFCSYGKRKGD